MYKFIITAGGHVSVAMLTLISRLIDFLVATGVGTGLLPWIPVAVIVRSFDEVVQTDDGVLLDVGGVCFFREAVGFLHQIIVHFDRQ